MERDLMEAAAERRPSVRRWLALGVALVGGMSLVVGLMWGQEGLPTAKQAKRSPSATNQSGVVQPGQLGRPPTNRPGGVGPAPEKTGLPAVPAPGGKVRTGTKEQGCFGSIREYLDQWDRTGMEPDPCFTIQPPSEQPQPAGVKRSYNGERF
jgi:hypothetical protein